MKNYRTMQKKMDRSGAIRNIKLLAELVTVENQEANKLMIAKADEWIAEFEAKYGERL